MPTSRDSDNTLLVGLVGSKADLTLVRDEHWYRIPVRSAPRRSWPPQWFAPLESVQASGESAQVIRSYGRVLSVRQATREELFPGAPTGDRAGRVYHRLELTELRERPPIYLGRPRRHAFIPTTIAKFERAASVNDLFDDSPIEDAFWDALKSEDIPAERQWPETVSTRRFYIDFAVFCNGGGLAVEVDGQHHHNPDKAIADDERDSLLATRGWQMHHIPTRRIRDALRYEMQKLRSVINTKGGLLADGFVPRIFVDRGNSVQHSLFEPRTPYDASNDLDDDIDDDIEDWE